MTSIKMLDLQQSEASLILASLAHFSVPVNAGLLNFAHWKNGIPDIVLRLMKPDILYYSVVPDSLVPVLWMWWWY